MDNDLIHLGMCGFPAMKEITPHLIDGGDEMAPIHWSRFVIIVMTFPTFWFEFCDPFFKIEIYQFSSVA
ncbi:hypothetical protein A6A03_07715 [Chloroflexus islandicus]|uniref:Uncharacterized protein n=1 Tax=Chloroflexus islandicus TaxID=1707952 RepID=A0A178MIT5_9CHLR|nr:hypothetical protein A6A03_07715 [Chloroflexus islandicus]